MRAAVLFNPKKGDLDALRAAVATAEREHGWAESVWVATKKRDTQLLRNAVTSGLGLVVVSGGDGTVRRTIRELVDHQIPLGIVPNGTGNLLARQLGLPINDLSGAVDIAFGQSRERILDVIELSITRSDHSVEDDVSVVLSGVGLDAAMIANTQPALKRRFGWLAYVDGMRRSIPDLRPFEVRISFEGRPPRHAKVAAVFIANLGRLPGNVALVPDAKVDDGLLDLIVLQPKRLIDWVFIWRRFSWENAVLRRTGFGSQIAEAFKGRNRSQVVYRRGTQLRVWIEQGARPFQIDGDSAGDIIELGARVNPQGVRVRVPE